MGKMNSEEVMKVLETFLDGTCGDHDWDGFLYADMATPRLKEIRDECAVLWDRYPSKNESEYCSDEGAAVIQKFIEELKGFKTSNEDNSL